MSKTTHSIPYKSQYSTIHIYNNGVYTDSLIITIYMYMADAITGELNITGLKVQYHIR